VLDLFQTRNLRQLRLWGGNQSTFATFRSLTNDEKIKLTGFQLKNFEDLDINTLIDYLRPCTNLEFIKLNHVELVGDFPSTSATKLTLPKLNDFELVLESYPDLEIDEILNRALFFKKDPNSRNEVDVKKIFEFKTNIKIIFRGSTMSIINHDVPAFGLQLLIQHGLH